MVLFFREQFDAVINDDPATDEKLPSLQAYQVARRFMLVWKQDRDVDRVLRLCR